MKLSEYFDKDVSEFFTAFKAAMGSGAGAFTAPPGAVVPTQPAVTPTQQVRLYKWACELIGEGDQNVRARYGSDADITSWFQREAAPEFPDDQRHKFFPRW